MSEQIATIRRGLATLSLAVTERLIALNHGNAMETPAARRKLRRCSREESETTVRLMRIRPLNENGVSSLWIIAQDDPTRDKIRGDGIAQRNLASNDIKFQKKQLESTEPNGFRSL